jgi:hypothetical protein
MKKAHGQPAVSTMSEPRLGPTAAAKPATAPHRLTVSARWLCGKAPSTIDSDAGVSSAAPTACSTRAAISQATDAPGRRFAHRLRLARHVRAERGDRAAGLQRREKAIGQIGLDERTKRTDVSAAAGLGRARHDRDTVAAGALEGLDEQGIARLEVSVEAAVLQRGWVGAIIRRCSSRSRISSTAWCLPRPRPIRSLPTTCCNSPPR